MVSTEDFRIIGAKKLLLEGAGIKKNESLLIYSDEKLQNIANYIIEAAKELDIEDVTFIVNPEKFRPRKNAPKALLRALEGTNVFLYLFNRLSEETPPGTPHPYRRQIREAIAKNNVRNLDLFDPKPEYFDSGGIYADYEAVEEQGARLFKPFEDCKLVKITSCAGTNVSFQLNREAFGGRGVTYRGPSIELTKKHAPYHTGVQAPEAEGGCPPLMSTVNGKIAIDGAITGLGEPPVPVVFTFENGKILKVEGDKIFLEEMKRFIERLIGEKPNSLLCLDWIDEFSIGFNKWAKFDDNISNCEKVAGSSHFGIGHGSQVEGPKHGEYFDLMMKYPTIIVTKSDGTKIKVIENGEILV
jgi:hypothetical protein